MKFDVREELRSMSEAALQQVKTEVSSELRPNMRTTPTAAAITEVIGRTVSGPRYAKSMGGVSFGRTCPER